MAFSDPQSLTIGGTATSFPRTSSGVNAGVFTTADASYKLSISHTYGTRTRRLIRLDGTKIVSDPYSTDRNIPVGMSSYLVVDVPKLGYSVADETSHVSALLEYLTASTNAKLIQLLGGEN